MRETRETPARLEPGTGEPVGSKDVITIVNAAHEWVRLNPDLWDELQCWAVSNARAGRPFALREWIERVRWHDRVNGAGGDVKIRNEFSTVFGRMLVNKFPVVRPFISLKKSKYDFMLNDKEGQHAYR